MFINGILVVEVISFLVGSSNSNLKMHFLVRFENFFDWHVIVCFGKQKTPCFRRAFFYQKVFTEQMKLNQLALQLR